MSYHFEAFRPQRLSDEAKGLLAILITAVAVVVTSTLVLLVFP